MKTLRSGRLYRVTGASSQTGEDVEITVEAYDEADAVRSGNRQGIFVSGCVSAGPDGSNWATSAPSTAPPAAPAIPPRPAGASKLTFAEAVARDPMVLRLVRTHPKLEDRLKRLNEADRVFLSALAGEEMGISYRDSADMGRLMNRADTWNKA